MKNRIYFRLNWADYFKNNLSQFQKIDKEKGILVYQKLYKDVKRSISKKINETIVALDDSTRTVIAIPKVDYEDVLNVSLKYLEQNEDYESCAEIRDTLIKLKSKPKRKKNTPTPKLILCKLN